MNIIVSQILILARLQHCWVRIISYCLNFPSNFRVAMMIKVN